MPPLQPWDDMILNNVHLGKYGSVGESTSILIEEGVDVLFCGLLYVIIKPDVSLRVSYSPVWLMSESVTRLELYPLWHLANNSNALVNVTLTASAFTLTVGFLV